MSQGANKSFEQEVWENLSAIDVKDKIEKKNGISYLSWANAWYFLMCNYPESYYEVKGNACNDDETVTVNVSVTVKKGDKKLTRDMWLPVMTFNNKAIMKPNSLDVNKSVMRCLTKAIAMFGLGLSLYQKEDFDTKDDEYDGFKNKKTNQDTKKKYLEKGSKNWTNAIIAVKRDGNLISVKKHLLVRKEDEVELMSYVNNSINDNPF